MATYPLTHPLDGWHAAITSGGHQVVHRTDPDTKTLHVGYAGHNIADAEARLGGTGGGGGKALPVEFHSAAEKEFDRLDADQQDKAWEVLDRLSRGEPHPHDHALVGALKGWRAARINFLHRITHRYEDESGNAVSPEQASRLFVGHVGPHNYEDAIRRLTVRTATGFFRQAAEGPQEWYHGSGAAFDRFDFDRSKAVQGDGDGKHWNSHLGAHFTSDHAVAGEFAKRQGGGHVYHARLDLANPKHYDSEYDLDRDAAHWAHGNGYDLGPMMGNPAYREQTEPDEWQFLIRYDDEGNDRPDAREIAHGFRNHLHEQGHDGIVYGNEYEGAHNGFHADARHLSAIAFHPDQIKVTHRHGGNEPCGHHTAMRGTEGKAVTVEGAFREAGANGDLPDGLQLDFTPHYTNERWLPRPDTGERDTYHQVLAHVSTPDGAPVKVGALSWYPHSGEVAHVWVHPEYRRRGIASAMWNHGVESATDQGLTLPEHSVAQTDAGAAWAKRASSSQAALRAEAAVKTFDGHVMVAVVPPRHVAESLAQEGGQPADDLHITMAYLGRAADYSREELAWLPELVGAWAARQKPLDVRIGGVGKFSGEDEHVLHAIPDMRGGAQMHADLARYLTGHGYRLPSEHGWTPHMTLAYTNRHHRFMPNLEPHAWTATHVSTHIGNLVTSHRLGAGPVQ